MDRSGKARAITLAEAEEHFGGGGSGGGGPRRGLLSGLFERIAEPLRLKAEFSLSNRCSEQGIAIRAGGLRGTLEALRVLSGLG